MSIRIKGHILEDECKHFRTHHREVWVSSLLFLPLLVAPFLFCAADCSDQTFPMKTSSGQKRNPHQTPRPKYFHPLSAKKKKEPTSRARIKGSGAFCCGCPPGGLKEGVGFRVCWSWCWFSLKRHLFCSNFPGAHASQRGNLLTLSSGWGGGWGRRFGPERFCAALLLAQLMRNYGIADLHQIRSLACVAHLW